MAEEELLFQAETPLDFKVRVLKSRWQLIVTMKHPAMNGREAEVRSALENPDEVRQSRSDSSMLLFYKTISMKRWVCAVVRATAQEAFLVTAYPTDTVKEGIRIWPK